MMIKLTAADGHNFDCWMERPTGDSRGNIIILQEIFGVTDQLKALAHRYAADGYTVAIPALFDRQNPGTVVPFDAPLPGRDMMLAADLEQTVADIDATLQSLEGKTVVMGFCWGGGLAIRAAQDLGITGAIVFYGTRLPIYLDRPLKAPVLAHYATQDDHVPPEMLAEAMAYLPDMHVHKYDTGHAFANDARPAAYDKTSAEQAHARNRVFLKTHLA